MTPARLAAKRHRKEMRRRIIRASRRRRNFEKDRILRKFRRTVSVAAGTRKKRQIKIDLSKAKAETPKEPKKKRGLLGRVLGKKEDA